VEKIRGGKKGPPKKRQSWGGGSRFYLVEKGHLASRKRVKVTGGMVPRPKRGTENSTNLLAAKKIRRERPN